MKDKILRKSSMGWTARVAFTLIAAAVCPSLWAQMPVPPRIPDVELVNQRGEKIHFYSDLMKDKVVAINTIFTSCTTICPLAGTNFSQLQKMLKGSDVN